MTDDAGRGRLGDRYGGAAGNVGPLDPTADPRTDPGLPPPGGPVTGPVSSGPAPAGPAPAVKHSRTGVLWTGLILLGAIPGTLRILQLRRAARRGPR